MSLGMWLQTLHLTVFFICVRLSEGNKSYILIHCKLKLVLLTIHILCILNRAWIRIYFWMIFNWTKSIKYGTPCKKPWKWNWGGSCQGWPNLSVFNSFPPYWKIKLIWMGRKLIKSFFRVYQINENNPIHRELIFGLNPTVWNHSCLN